ncbi:uncharacterized protein PAC_04413 [Phialocephala subalpina]|uniref:Uncharacterized protein n=1 Tax=Phialocephala subalpina TaxID=576137 RepID=A0A1L7WP36_9HELO|nr:uncharacterized protein PAC_04413 [Phialocephala subalpina]
MSPTLNEALPADRMHTAEGPKVQDANAPASPTSPPRGPTSSPDDGSTSADFIFSSSEATDTNASSSGPGATQNITNNKTAPLNFYCSGSNTITLNGTVNGNVIINGNANNGSITNSAPSSNIVLSPDTQADASTASGSDDAKPPVWLPWNLTTSYDELLKRPTQDWAVQWETGKLHLLGLVPGEFNSDTGPSDVPGYMDRTGHAGQKHEGGKVDLPRGDWAIYTILARVGKMSKAAILGVLGEWLESKTSKDGKKVLPFTESTVRTYLTRHDDIFTSGGDVDKKLKGGKTYKMGLWRLRGENEECKEKGKGGHPTNKKGNETTTTAATLSTRPKRMLTRTERADKIHSTVQASLAEEQSEPEEQEHSGEEQRPKKRARRAVRERALQPSMEEEQPERFEVTSDAEESPNAGGSSNGSSPPVTLRSNGRRLLPSAPLGRPRKDDRDPYGSGTKPWNAYRPENPRAACNAEQKIGDARLAYLS